MWFDLSILLAVLNRYINRFIPATMPEGVLLILCIVCILVDRPLKGNWCQSQEIGKVLRLKGAVPVLGGGVKTKD